MQILPIHEPIIQETRKALRKTAKSVPGKDSVSLSGKAISIPIASIQAQAQASPDIREDRVKEVKERITAGFYNTPEFLDALTENLAQYLGYHPHNT